MENTCLHCDYTIDENFCRNCGQKRFKRIDRKYVIDEIQYVLIHTNKGFLYTVKNLAKSPGGTARRFIEGDRVNHYKPILLTFLLSGISAVISFKIIGLATIMKEFYTSQHMNSPFMNDYMAISTGYNAFIMLGLVPLFALTTWIAFHKWKANYYEHVVMNAYILSTYTLVSIVFVYPILFLLRHNMSYFTTATSLSTLIVPFILVWFFKGYYPEKPMKQIVGRVLATLGLTLVAMGILMVILMIVVAVYVFAQGPEGAKYFLPAQA
ncbi:DUF3667 domain-containing protein [Pedobacter xixiisoli]|uniref:DUF3667 domain-containing protein n=1 Tax=Pedobacter xixiisoli TaxID=1476464 RepID=A0A285ZXI3_9SPHI|nr:DUF3667 domain-containing protein [Pedobacter xixiisoli]SOD14348.1 Protein of unknown function [Pedobacter xixiisoli]